MGESIEDRGSQITFSALGQLAPIEEKRRWDPDDTKSGGSSPRWRATSVICAYARAATRVSM